MKIVIFIIITFFLLTICLFTSKAQQLHQTISAAGGNATGSGGSVSYTIGQLFYKTMTSENGSICEGIQQPFEISIIDDVIELREIKLDIVVYPNPVSRNLNLKIDNHYQQNKLLGYQFFDIDGKLLEEKRITNIETLIDVCGYSSSIYILKVIDYRALENATVNQKYALSNHVLKTYKILKN